MCVNFQFEFQQQSWDMSTNGMQMFTLHDWNLCKSLLVLLFNVIF